MDGVILNYFGYLDEFVGKKNETFCEDPILKNYEEKRFGYVVFWNVGFWMF